MKLRKKKETKDEDGDQVKTLRGTSIYQCKLCGERYEERLVIQSQFFSFPNFNIQKFYQETTHRCEPEGMKFGRGELIGIELGREPDPDKENPMMPG